MITSNRVSNSCNLNDRLWNQTTDQVILGIYYIVAFGIFIGGIVLLFKLFGYLGSLSNKNY